jgi:hypothetical protein
MARRSGLPPGKEFKMRTIGHFIGGKEVSDNSGRTGDVFDPNTGELTRRRPNRHGQRLIRSVAPA